MTFVPDALHDLRQAMRSLRRAPGYTLAAALTLALGIGLNAAVLSAVYGVLLRPLDVPDAGRLYSIWQDMGARGGDRQDYTSRPVFADWRARNRSFSGMALFIHGTLDLNALGMSVPSARVSHDFFQVLGVKPALGRAFLPHDETKNNTLAILADPLWRRLGADRAIVGKQIKVSDISFTVVGVLPPGFHAPLTGDAELFNVMDFSPPLRDRSYNYANVIGRLRPGVSPAAAQADMDRVARSIAADYPKEMHGIGARIEPLLDSVVGKARKALRRCGPGGGVPTSRSATPARPRGASRCARAWCWWPPRSPPASCSWSAPGCWSGRSPPWTASIPASAPTAWSSAVSWSSRSRSRTGNRSRGSSPVSRIGCGSGRRSRPSERSLPNRSPAAGSRWGSASRASPTPRSSGRAPCSAW
jgi:hypothetical protein